MRDVGPGKMNLETCAGVQRMRNSLTACFLSSPVWYHIAHGVHGHVSRDLNNEKHDWWAWQTALGVALRDV